jgi:branched-chain amino acid transport system substrate-binding protein
MRRRGTWVVLGAALMVAVAMTATAASGAVTRSEAKKPIIIGAAMDLTANMAPYDTPALYAVQLAATKINAQGGIGGRRLQVNVCNHQLKNQKTCALQLIQQGAVIGMVTCDVEYAAPAVQEFINKGMLTLAPCIGTDQMGPKRFGPNGRLAFTFGNIAQDEAAAMAEYAYGRGWRRAVIVKDNLLAYFQNVADLFKARFTELGGTVVQEEGFSSFSNTIQNAISKVAPTNADVIAFPTAFDGLAPFVGGLRALGNNTPIINSWGGDGNYWWPQNPPVRNYYYVTYGSIYGDDPKSAVNRLVREVTAINKGETPATGSFIPGADLVDALVAAIKGANGSTKGAVLAARLEKFKGFQATSGKITFSKTVHGVTGRAYRVMVVNNNRAKFVRFWKTKKLARLP